MDRQTDIQTDNNGKSNMSPPDGGRYKYGDDPKQEGHEALNHSPEYTGKRLNII